MSIWLYIPGDEPWSFDSLAEFVLFVNRRWQLGASSTYEAEADLLYRCHVHDVDSRNA